MAEWEWTGIPTGTPFLLKAVSLLLQLTLSTFQVSELVLLLTKYELQTGVKISNTSLVCRKDGVEMYESVRPTRDGLCTVSIPDMQLAD